MFDRELSQELRRKLVEGIRAGREAHVQPAQDVYALEPHVREAKLFAPAADQLTRFARGMEIRVRGPHRSLSRSQKMERCVAPHEIVFMSDSPRAFLSLYAVQKDGVQKDGVSAWLHGVYVSDIGQTAEEFWMQDGTGVLDCSDGVRAAVDWFVDHMGEFVLSRRLDEGSTVAGDASWPRGRELATRLLGSIQRSGEQNRVYMAELAQDRELFSPLAQTLTRFAAANRVRVDCSRHDKWLSSVPLQALISGTSIALRKRSQDTGLLERLSLGIDRPPREPGIGRTPVLRGVRRRSRYGILATREWSIPKPGTAAFDVTVREAVTWFAGEMAPFVTNQKRFAGRQLG